MAEELKIEVTQTPAVIEWNFEQLKGLLEEKMNLYEGLTYTEDNVKTAKADVADLRKLKNAVEERKKDIKKKCLEPYEEIERQAKELTALIDKPIDSISKQVKNFEDAQRAERRKAITEYMDESFRDFPDEVSNQVKLRMYEPSWENKTTTKKAWTEAIDSIRDRISGDLNRLKEVEEDFRESAMAVYVKRLDLAEAMWKVNELQTQREMLREKERIRAEREAAEASIPTVGQVIESIEHEAFQAATANDSEDGGANVPPTDEKPSESPQKAPADDLPEGIQEITLKVWCNKVGKQRIFGYFKHAGIIFKEV